MKAKEFFDFVGDWAQFFEWLMIHVAMVGILVLAVVLVIRQLFA